MTEQIIPKTTRRPVVSSNIAAIGFYPQLLILEVEFLHGGVYHYFGVPESVYEAFIAAPSHGKYFHRHIRDVYRYSLVQDSYGHRTRRRVGGESAGTRPDQFRIFACDWCYEMLGASRTDDLGAIRSAYHKKAHLYHPDKGGNEEEMKRLNEAFALTKEALSNK